MNNNKNQLFLCYNNEEIFWGISPKRKKIINMAIRVTLKDNLAGEALKSKLSALGLELVYNEKENQLFNNKEEKNMNNKSPKQTINKKNDDKK
ncbi:MAG: hypothetical protein PHS24_01355 [Bacilli bacterium]|nr:hypothetical protein [Bacilli bacterium]